MIELYPEFFNDVFGPIMQPGSSSHMAAPCRLGYLANSLLGEKPTAVKMIMDKEGSFAGTFGLMNEDKGMLAGALGLLPDDVRLFQAREIARQKGITYEFAFTEMKESPHINAIKFILEGKSGNIVSLVGDSTGGGMIETRIINGFPLQLKGDTYVLLVLDPSSLIRSEHMDKLTSELEEIVDSGIVKTGIQGEAYFFKVSEPPQMGKIMQQFPGMEIRLLKPVLPVITRSNKQPQLFNTMTRWRELTKEKNSSLWEVALEYEMFASGWSREKIINYMKKISKKMHRQTRAAFEENLPVVDNPFKAQLNNLWDRYLKSNSSLSGPVMASAVKWVWGAGVAMPGVEIVPGPMGTGGGFVYAALSAVKDAHGFSDDDLLRGLFIAAGIGALAYSRTRPTGEVIGCTGECGICGAMAAGAVTEMAGGTSEQVENAASLSLQSAIGWPCDPIPGGNEQPCNSRVMTATCMAIVFADLALAGRDSVLPLHEVIDVADTVGRRLTPDLLCTSKGGCCAAPAAKRLSEKYAKWFKEKNR